MNPKNILNLLSHIFEDPVYNVESSITAEERSFAFYLADLIKDSADSQLFMDSYDTLCYNDSSVIPEAVIVTDEQDDDFQDSVQDNEESEDFVSLEYKKQAVEFWHSGKKRKRSLETVQHRFAKVKHRRMLYRWEEHVDNGGTRTDKLLHICEYVLEQFSSASDRCLPIHDIDLKRWALKAREDVQLHSTLFKASSRWVHNFKIRHGIVSRKINKFVTQTQFSSRTELSQKASNFVNKVKSEICVVGEANVYNSDQSGFNLETHAGRTLSLKGSLKVECVAQSLNSLTHSYTIQPIISADGILKSPLLIVLQETNGEFGPTVEKSIYKADNICVYPSKSGKLTCNLVIKWFENVFLSVADERSVLCLDSWTGQTEKTFDNTDKGTKEVKILTIPAGTTGLIQPLDVYVFRPWKNFLKHFSDLILLYNYKINLHLRNNILKIQSLIHNQFSSPRFVNMFKYAWWKSGYISDKPDKCETPVDYCFKNAGTDCNLCNKIAVIKCAWCTKSLCIQHFFAIQDENLPHYCHVYVK